MDNSSSTYYAKFSTQRKVTTNIINNICGNVYILKIDENNKIVNFNKEQIEEIMQSIGS